MKSEDRARAEFLAKATGNFRSFCGLVDIVNKEGVRQKLTLNPIQKRFCRELTGRDIALKPRQVGFTTEEQARDIYRFLFKPGSRVVTTCQSITDNGPKKQLSGNYRLMFDSLRRVGLKLDFHTEATSEWILADRDSSLRIIEAGASEAAAQKKGRSGTITRLHLTETAFYEYAAETLNALLECVPGHSTGSEIVSESTPNGAAGVFYDQCNAARRGESEYKFHFYPWFEQAEYSTPLTGPLGPARSEKQAKFEAMLRKHGVTDEQINWYRGKVADKGASKTAQEYPTDPDSCFLLSGAGFFDPESIASGLLSVRSPETTRDARRIRIFETPKPGKSYLISVDTSEGNGGDPGAALVYERESGDHVATVDGQYQPPELARVTAELGREYNDALIAVERNNHGHTVLYALTETLRYRNVYHHDDKKPGFPTNLVTRPIILDELEDSIRSGLWRSPDEEVWKQIRTFVVRDGKPQAAKGAHDDLVMAAAIGWKVRQLPVFNYSPAPAGLALF